MVLRKIVEHDTSLFPFRVLIEDFLGEKDLELIHERYNVPLVARENDQETDYHSSINSSQKFEVGGYYEKL